MARLARRLSRRGNCRVSDGLPPPRSLARGRPLRRFRPARPLARKPAHCGQCFRSQPAPRDRRSVPFALAMMRSSLVDTEAPEDLIDTGAGLGLAVEIAAGIDLLECGRVLPLRARPRPRLRSGSCRAGERRRLRSAARRAADASDGRRRTAASRLPPRPRPDSDRALGSAIKSSAIFRASIPTAPSPTRV